MSRAVLDKHDNVPSILARCMGPKLLAYLKLNKFSHMIQAYRIGLAKSLFPNMDITAYDLAPYTLSTFEWKPSSQTTAGDENNKINQIVFPILPLYKQFLQYFGQTMPDHLFEDYSDEPVSVVRIKRLWNLLILIEECLDLIEQDNGLTLLWQSSSFLRKTEQAFDLLFSLNINLIDLVLDVLQYSQRGISQVADLVKHFEFSLFEIDLSRLHQNIELKNNSRHLGLWSGILVAQLDAKSCDRVFLSKTFLNIPQNLTAFVTSLTDELSKQHNHLGDQHWNHLQDKSSKLIHQLEHIQLDAEPSIQSVSNFFKYINQIRDLMLHSINNLAVLTAASHAYLLIAIRHIKYQILLGFLLDIEQLELILCLEPGSLSQLYLKEVKYLYESLINAITALIILTPKDADLKTLVDISFAKERSQIKAKRAQDSIQARNELELQLKCLQDFNQGDSHANFALLKDSFMQVDAECCESLWSYLNYRNTFLGSLEDFFNPRDFSEYEDFFKKTEDLLNSKLAELKYAHIWLADSDNLWYELNSADFIQEQSLHQKLQAYTWQNKQKPREILAEKWQITFADNHRVFLQGPKGQSIEICDIMLLQDLKKYENNGQIDVLLTDDAKMYYEDAEDNSAPEFSYDERVFALERLSWVQDYVKTLADDNATGQLKLYLQIYPLQKYILDTDFNPWNLSELNLEPSIAALASSLKSSDDCIDIAPKIYPENSNNPRARYLLPQTHTYQIDALMEAFEKYVYPYFSTEIQESLNLNQASSYPLNDFVTVIAEPRQVRDIKIIYNNLFNVREFLAALEALPYRYSYTEQLNFMPLRQRIQVITTYFQMSNFMFYFGRSGLYLPFIQELFQHLDEKQKYIETFINKYNIPQNTDDMTFDFFYWNKLPRPDQIDYLTHWFMQAPELLQGNVDEDKTKAKIHLIFSNRIKAYINYQYPIWVYVLCSPFLLEIAVTLREKCRSLLHEAHKLSTESVLDMRSKGLFKDIYQYVDALEVRFGVQPGLLSDFIHHIIDAFIEAYVYGLQISNQDYWALCDIDDLYSERIRALQDSQMASMIALDDARKELSILNDLQDLESVNRILEKYRTSLEYPTQTDLMSVQESAQHKVLKDLLGFEHSNLPQLLQYIKIKIESDIKSLELEHLLIEAKLQHLALIEMPKNQKEIQHRKKQVLKETFKSNLEQILAEEEKTIDHVSDFGLAYLRDLEQTIREAKEGIFAHENLDIPLINQEMQSVAKAFAQKHKAAYVQKIRIDQAVNDLLAYLGDGNDDLKTHLNLLRIELLHSQIDDADNLVDFRIRFEERTWMQYFYELFYLNVLSSVIYMLSFGYMYLQPDEPDVTVRAQELEQVYNDMAPDDYEQERIRIAKDYVHSHRNLFFVTSSIWEYVLSFFGLSLWSKYMFNLEQALSVAELDLSHLNRQSIFTCCKKPVEGLTSGENSIHRPS